jgi:hypothetical protein
MGRLVFFRFLDFRRPFDNQGDDTRTWSIPNIADALKSLPRQGLTRSLELWVRADSIEFGFWAPDKIAIDQLERHWKTFNAGLVEYRPGEHFPALGPHSTIRIGRVRPARNASYPIETGFGSRGVEGRTSPIVHLLNNLPKMPPGSTLVIQIVWRRLGSIPGLWRNNPFTHIGLPHHVDHEAKEWKAQVDLTYYVDIRLLEIHEDPRNAGADYCHIMGQAFEGWTHRGGNELRYKHLGLWTRSRLLRFVRAVRSRNSRYAPIRFTRKPHLAKEEMASLVHPPPMGSEIPRLLHTNIQNFGASSSQKTQARTLEELLLRRHAKKDGQVHGRQRKFTAEEMRRLLQSRRSGGQP